jgi:5-methylcytosine-specific restriction protein A
MNRETFIRALHAIFGRETRNGQSSVVVRSGDLHRMVGGYPGNNHRMPVCCAAMRAEMREGDHIVRAPPRGNGANVYIEYRLPR